MWKHTLNGGAKARAEGKTQINLMLPDIDAAAMWESLSEKTQKSLIRGLVVRCATAKVVAANKDAIAAGEARKRVLQVFEDASSKPQFASMSAVQLAGVRASFFLLQGIEDKEMPIRSDFEFSWNDLKPGADEDAGGEDNEEPQDEQASENVLTPDVPTPPAVEPPAEKKPKTKAK